MIYCTQLTFDLFLRLRSNYRLGIHPYVSCQISRNNISVGRIMYSILPSKVKISVFFQMGLPTNRDLFCWDRTKWEALGKCRAYSVIWQGYKAIGMSNEDCREYVAILYMTLVHLSMLRNYHRELDNLIPYPCVDIISSVFSLKHLRCRPCAKIVCQIPEGSVTVLAV